MKKGKLIYSILFFAVCLCPSLGMLVKNGFDVLFSGYWWIAVMPGLYIMLIVFGINLLGDFLRDEFNPKLK